jgi:hypothetical protein
MRRHDAGGDYILEDGAGSEEDVPLPDDVECRWRNTDQWDHRTLTNGVVVLVFFHSQARNTDPSGTWKARTLDLMIRGRVEPEARGRSRCCACVRLHVGSTQGVV